MNQIDKILPSKEEVDELFKKEPIRVAIIGAFPFSKLKALRMATITALENQMIICDDFSKNLEKATISFKELIPYDIKSLNVFEEKPKKKNVFFKRDIVPSSKRRFGK